MNDDAMKMLRMVLNGQSRIDERLVTLKKELLEVEDRLRNEIKSGNKNIIKRVDKLGLDLAKL